MLESEVRCLLDGSDCKAASGLLCLRWSKIVAHDISYLTLLQNAPFIPKMLPYQRSSHYFGEGCFSDYRNRHETSGQAFSLSQVPLSGVPLRPLMQVSPRNRHTWETVCNTAERSQDHVMLCATGLETTCGFLLFVYGIVHAKRRR